ncbi:MAG TPA: maleylacetoacetate isomerase [Candidatus Binataceae bacterium]|nr:maleylacetoacetate isomerase [Candidatus Binataceae bacterium]
MMKLYSYFRSSASYRVRIALELKGLSYEYVAVHLRRGEQSMAEYREINPAGLVPALTDGGAILTQSTAIIEYLEESYPAPALLPADSIERARVRALAQTVACEMHPLNNLRVLQHLRREFALTEDDTGKWYHHWLGLGFAAFEAMLANDARTGRYCHGDQPTMADIYLVPQIYNAERFRFDLAPYPVTRRIVAQCRTLEAFQRAAPERQPDAES